MAARPEGRGRIGSKVRAAIWLANDVGEGRVFTTAALRDAVPGIGQVDRRMRELRARGWRIDTRRQDPTLMPNELRLVTIGEPVWDRDVTSRVEGRLSAVQRRGVLARDSYLCVVCGIAAGEPYPDAPHLTGVLTVVARSGGEDPYVTECSRCRAGGVQSAPTPEQVRALVQRLAAPDRAALAQWCAGNHREPAPATVAWAALRQLPAPDREAIVQSIAAGE